MHLEEGNKAVEKAEVMSCEKRLKTLGLSRSRGDFIALYSFLRMERKVLSSPSGSPGNW